MVFRTYVEKRQGLAPECEALLTDCRDFLGVQGLRAAKIAAVRSEEHTSELQSPR